jgi:hypothetical protein
MVVIVLIVAAPLIWIGDIIQSLDALRELAAKDAPAASAPQPQDPTPPGPGVAAAETAPPEAPAAAPEPDPTISTTSWEDYVRNAFLSDDGKLTQQQRGDYIAGHVGMTVEWTGVIRIERGTALPEPLAASPWYTAEVINNPCYTKPVTTTIGSLIAAAPASEPTAIVIGDSADAKRKIDMRRLECSSWRRERDNRRKAGEEGYRTPSPQPDAKPAIGFFIVKEPPAANPELEYEWKAPWGTCLAGEAGCEHTTITLMHRDHAARCHIGYHRLPINTLLESTFVPSFRLLAPRPAIPPLTILEDGDIVRVTGQLAAPVGNSVDLQRCQIIKVAKHGTDWSAWK